MFNLILKECPAKRNNTPQLFRKRHQTDQLSEIFAKRNQFIKNAGHDCCFFRHLLGSLWSLHFVCYWSYPGQCEESKFVIRENCCLKIDTGQHKHTYAQELSMYYKPI